MWDKIAEGAAGRGNRGLGNGEKIIAAKNKGLGEARRGMLGLRASVASGWVVGCRDGAVQGEGGREVGQCRLRERRGG